MNKIDRLPGALLYAPSGPRVHIVDESGLRASLGVKSVRDGLRDTLDLDNPGENAALVALLLALEEVD